MTVPRTYLLAAALLLSACKVNVVRTTDPEPAPSAAIATGMREAILAEMTRSKDAWNAADLAGHVALYTDSATMMTREGPRGGRDVIRGMLERGFWEGGKPKAQLDFTDLVVTPLGGSHALVTGAFKLTWPEGRTTGGRYTLVWMKEGNAWRVMHDNSN